AAPAAHDLDLGPAQQAADAVAQPVDDAVLPAHGLGEIQADVAGDPQAQRIGALRPAQHAELAGGVDQRLRRDAAAEQAGAAQAVGLDQHGVEAELAGADGGDIAAGPGAEHQDLDLGGRAHRGSTNNSAGVSIRRRMAWMNSAASQPSTTR